jgi:alkylation response protein AidB-like acyl-CoA dehydrogenase
MEARPLSESWTEEQLSYDLGADAGALRDHLRQIIAEHVPADFLGAFTSDGSGLDVVHEFVAALAAEQLLTMAWPAAYGGRDASIWEVAALREEMWAYHEPRGSHYMGLNWVGPAILRHGTEAQKARYLPAIANGSSAWCQGFSEPEAGSDLASLRTRAERTDRGWVVTGQKVWTSYAELADHCVLAARTGSQESRRNGISLFLVPMDRSGFEIRPLKTFLGRHHLNELFLDGVLVEEDEILGTENGGWDVITAALAHERIGIARYARGDRLLSLAVAQPGFLDALPPGLRARLTRALVHTRVARLLNYDSFDLLQRGVVDHAAASVARIASVRIDQEASDVLSEAITEGDLHPAVEDFWRYSRSSLVPAGAVDIQRMLVAREALVADGGGRNGGGDRS